MLPSVSTATSTIFHLSSSSTFIPPPEAPAASSVVSPSYLLYFMYDRCGGFSALPPPSILHFKWMQFLPLCVSLSCRCCYICSSLRFVSSLCVVNVPRAGCGSIALINGRKYGKALKNVTYFRCSGAKLLSACMGVWLYVCWLLSCELQEIQHLFPVVNSCPVVPVWSEYLIILHSNDCYYSCLFTSFSIVLHIFRRTVLSHQQTGGWAREMCSFNYFAESTATFHLIFFSPFYKRRTRCVKVTRKSRRRRDTHTNIVRERHTTCS